MIQIRFGKRQGLANIPRIGLSQRIVPAFHMIGFACALAHAPMRFFWKDQRIRIPEITETVAVSVGSGNPLPQLLTGLLTAITNREGDNLACAPTHSCPQPALVGTLGNKGPNLIHFQSVRWARGREGLGNRRSISGFFLTRPLRSDVSLRTRVESHAYWDAHNTH